MTMWVATHVLVGLAIAAAIGGPWWLLVALALASHVLMDLVPHYDYTVSRHPVRYGVLDFGASLGAFLICWLPLGWPLWLASVGLISGAPDWDVLIATLRGDHARKWFPSHWASFPHGRAGPPWGISVQVALMAVSVAVIVVAGPQ